MKEDPDRLSRGIDFLDIKNGLLAEYNTNLAYLVMKKTRGELIEGDKVVERLCYLRTMLEKIRPIEHKLKFQIDKYVNLAETGQVRPDDPTRFKANPGMLSSKLGEGEDESDDDEDDEEGEGVGPGLINLVGDKFSPNNPGGRVEGELDSNWGQLQLLDGVRLTENTTGGSINKNAVLVDNVDDGGDLALVGTLASKDGHTANLHKLLERHRELLSCRSESSNKSLV